MSSRASAPVDVSRPPLTVGIEEEVLLLDPQSGAPAPVASKVLDRVAGDARFTGELPAAQIEIRLPPADTVGDALAALRTARADLTCALAGLARPAAAGVHPCAPARGVLNDDPRYETLRAEFGPLAQLQQVCALQVHVDVGGPARTIAVHDALREYLPDIAALAANAPVYGALDSGFASVRPLICGLLPRQGVPPALIDPARHAAELTWGASAGVSDPATWWWEMRPHAVHGTLEIRVADGQTTLGQAGAVMAFVVALAATIGRDIDAHGARPVAPTWRIEENRWAVCRDGLGATVTDVHTGERAPVADRLLDLVAGLRPAAAELGCARELAVVRHLVAAGGGAAGQRRAAFAHGIAALPEYLADRYLDESV